MNQSPFDGLGPSPFRDGMEEDPETSRRAAGGEPASPPLQSGPAGFPESGAAPRGSFRRRFEPLTMRLAVGIALFVLVPLAVGLYVLSQQHLARTIEVTRRGAEAENRILETALRHQMMEKDSTLMTAILEEVGAQPDVRSAMILNHKGEVRLSSRPETVGTVLPLHSAACQACHSQTPEERDRWILTEDEGGRLLRSVLPIENRAECHECHDPDDRFNGILMLTISMDEVWADLNRDVLWIIGGAFVLALLLLAGVGFLVRNLILLRLARLGRTARSIAAGNLDDRAILDGDDLITSLAADFNDMATALARLVDEVREQDVQLTSILSSLDDGLVVLDRGFRVIASNRAFCRRLGVHSEVLDGRSCRELGGGGLPCCLGEGDCPAQQCFETGEVQRAVFQVPEDGGTVERVEEVYASPVFDDRGEVVRVVELWRNITERVKEEERLAEIERMASLGVLASGLSHEMNTPLASMLTSAEAILGRIEEGTSGMAEEAGAAIQESARIIRDQVLRCRTTTDQFLRFSRGIPPAVEPLDLHQLLVAAIALVEPTASEVGVRVILETELAVAPVRANSEVVQHVLLNLLVNAIQSCDTREGEVKVSTIVGQDVRVQIEDTGCGIAPDDRKHLFEPFRSRKTEGTGLGLFLSRSFMRRFSGDVCLAWSEEGKGACFQIVFARLDEEWE